MKELKRYLHKKYDYTSDSSQLSQLETWLDFNEQQILENSNPAEYISKHAKELLLPITEDDTSAFADILAKMEKSDSGK